MTFSPISMIVQVRVEKGNRTIAEISGGLVVYTNARRENNLANIDIMKQLSEHFSVDISRIRLIRGRTSRKKTFSIDL